MDGQLFPGLLAFLPNGFYFWAFESMSGRRLLPRRDLFDLLCEGRLGHYFGTGQEFGQSWVRFVLLFDYFLEHGEAFLALGWGWFLREFAGLELAAGSGACFLFYGKYWRFGLDSVS